MVGRAIDEQPNWGAVEEPNEYFRFDLDYSGLDENMDEYEGRVSSAWTAQEIIDTLYEVDKLPAEFESAYEDSTATLDTVNDLVIGLGDASDLYELLKDETVESLAAQLYDEAKNKICLVDDEIVNLTLE